MTDQTPRTEAGRALAASHWDASVDCGMSRVALDDAILAIEAEAAAQARTECEERNERLQQTLALHTRTDSVTMTTEHYDMELAQARTEALSEAAEWVRAIPDAEWHGVLAVRDRVLLAILAGETE